MPLTTYTAGDILTASSLNANLSFAAQSGGLTLITAETPFTGAATVSVNNCFTSAYTSYKLIIRITSASNQVALRLRASSTDSSTGYYSVNYDMYSSALGSSGTVVQQNATYQFVGNEGSFNQFEIMNPQIASQTYMAGNGSRWESTTPRAESTVTNYKCVHSVATAYDGFTLFPVVGASITGHYTLYGYAKA